MSFADDVRARQRALATGDSFVMATVTQVKPLRVQLDTDTAQLDVTPVKLASVRVLVGDRVWCQLHGRQLVVIDRIATALDEWQAATFINGWGNYSTLPGGYERAMVRRNGDRGEATGLIKHATTTTTGGAIQLPAELWPDLAHIDIQMSNTGQVRWTVKENNGQLEIYAYYNGGSGGFVSLDGLSWPLGEVSGA